MPSYKVGQIDKSKFKDSLNALLEKPQESKQTKGKKHSRAIQESDVVPKIPQERGKLSEGRKLADMLVSLPAETTEPLFLTSGDKKHVKMHNTAFKKIVKQFALSKDSIEYKNLSTTLDKVSEIPNTKHAKIALKYLTDNAQKILDNDYTQNITNISLDMMSDAMPRIASNKKKISKKTSGAGYKTQEVINTAFSMSATLGKENFIKLANHFVNSADKLKCMSQNYYADSLFVKSIYNFSKDQVATIIDSKTISEKHLNFLCKYNHSFQEYNAKQQSQDVATPTASTNKYRGRKLPATPNETPIPTASTNKKHDRELPPDKYRGRELPATPNETPIPTASTNKKHDRELPPDKYRGRELPATPN